MVFPMQKPRNRPLSFCLDVGVVPGVEFACSGVLRRLPGRRIVRLDVRLQILANLLEERMVPMACHYLVEGLTHLDQMDVEILQNKQTAVTHAHLAPAIR